MVADPLAPTGASTGGHSAVPRPSSPKSFHTGSAATAARNSPRGSAQRSSLGAGHIERPRRRHREQSRAARPASRPRARHRCANSGQNQCGNRRRDAGDRLAVVSPFEGRAAAARLVGDDHREPLVARAGPEGRLAVAASGPPRSRAWRSTSGSRTSQSRIRDSPQAQAAIAPGSSAGRRPRRACPATRARSPPGRRACRERCRRSRRSPRHSRGRAGSRRASRPRLCAREASVARCRRCRSCALCGSHPAQRRMPGSGCSAWLPLKLRCRNTGTGRSLWGR